MRCIMYSTMSKRKCCGEETRIDLGKTQNGKASDQKDHFCRLPEEIFVYILTIVADLKSLCKCSLVSKHFASVVFRVRAVCVTIPNSSVPTKPKLKSLVFLEQFRELESIYLEYKYKYPVSRDNSPVSKWKVKFSTNFHKIEIFVTLLSSSVHKQAANEPQNNLTFKDIMRLEDGRRRCVEWMGIVFMLGKSHMSLKKVITTDSRKEGKIVIGEEYLVRIRSCIHEPEPPEVFRRPQVVEQETATIPVLHLPLSGYVMRHVYLRILDFQTEPHPSTIDEILSWDFEDEVLNEAIKEIYKNHNGKIRKTSILA